MIELLDGPAKGNYLVKRSPMWLRAVVNTKTNEMDLLDQIDDEPKKNEAVFIYRLQGEAGYMHVYARGKGGKSTSGFYATGQYKFIIANPEIDTKALRDNLAWQVWVAAQAAKEGLTVDPLNGYAQQSIDKEMPNGR